MTRRILVLFLLTLTSIAVAQDRPLTPAELVAAQRAVRPVPRVSQNFDVTVEQAYAFQKKVVELGGGDRPIIGYKAGLTSEAAQERFGIDHPVAGVLPFATRLDPDLTIERRDWVVMMLEVELAFTMKDAITEPVSSIDDLKKNVAAVAPAIELPDLGFTDIRNATAADIIAANVGARGVIYGQETAIGDLDLNALAVSLKHDDKTILEAKGADAMGDQWKALLWLVNTSIKNGYAIQPGQRLITGALGPMLPGKPGSYQADFGQLGSIAFTITD